MHRRHGGSLRRHRFSPLLPFITAPLVSRRRTSSALVISGWYGGRPRCPATARVVPVRHAVLHELGTCRSGELLVISTEFAGRQLLLRGGCERRRSEHSGQQDSGGKANHNCGSIRKGEP